MGRLFGIVVVLAVVAVGTHMLGYWSLDQVTGTWRSATPATGTAGTDTARDRADRPGTQARQAAQKVDDYVSDAELTAKIKAKMALDDGVRAQTISVATTGGVVTLTGTVGSASEHDRAVRLARDTKGIKQVVDRLTVVRP